jgi:amidase
MTGIFTIRPSYGRFPHFDARSGMAGQEAVASVHGPMAQSVGDLKLFAQSVVNACPWRKDPKCIEIPWRPVTLPERLKIAVLWHDGICQPTPPVARALREVAAQLKSRGHEIVDWDARGHDTALDLIAKFFLADGGKSIRKILEAADEPFRPEMKPYETATELGVYDLWQLQRERTDLSKMYLDKWEASEGVDAILLPTTPYAAVKNGAFKYIGYTGVFNILDYSAVSFPTGLHADEKLDAVPEDFKALSEIDETTAKEYDAAAVHGMPISLQLAGRRLQEEKMLEVADRVVKDLVW